MQNKILKGQVTLITRPEAQQNSLRAAIECRGGEWLSLPLLRIVPLTDSDLQAARQHVQDLDNYDVLVFVSLNAASLGAELITDLWPQLPVQQSIIAIGKSTAKLVADLLACEVICPEAGSDSEAVLAIPELQQLADKRIGIFRGQGGRELLAATLRERGASVDYIEVYKREQVQHDAAAFAAPDKIDAITVHSGESLHSLAGLLSTARKSILAIPIVVPSARVAKQAEQSGFKQVVNAHGADDASMIKALERIHANAD
ncbi:MAG: uroporphyrinogen-III synthase [Pseudomonadales bacterium]|nr:uroporphyrinogen-III synthase [Pseudomonadales bacterium]